MVLERESLHDWAILGVNVGKYSIHGASGFSNQKSNEKGDFLVEMTLKYVRSKRLETDKIDQHDCISSASKFQKLC